MNLSAVSSIKFTGENIQPAEVKSQQPQQTPEAVQTQPKEKKSKFAELKQLAKDTYSKSTPENTTNLFLTSGIMGIVSGVLNHVGKNHNVIKAIGTVGTIGAIASFALAASHVIKDRAEDKQPVETAEPAKSPQPAPSAEIKEADEKQTEVVNAGEEPVNGVEEEANDAEEQTQALAQLPEENTASAVGQASASNAAFADFQK